MSTSPYPAPKKRKPFVKWIIALLVIGGLAVLASKMLGGSAPKEDPMAAAMKDGMPASVAGALSRPVTAWSEFSGRLEAVDSAEIRPRASGQISAIHFKDGDTVKRGQPLFTIDTRPYEAELARARGQAAAAASAQKNAAADFTRAGTLIKTKAISKAEFERAQSAAEQANGALEAARGAVRGAEVNLSYARITAPIGGKISRAEITVGNNVEAGPNAPLLASIVDLTPIYASFELDEKTYLSALQHVPATQLKSIPVEVVLGEGAAAPLKATVHSFDNQIAPGSGTIRVRAILPNENSALMPGMFAKVRIGSPEQTPSVLINPVAIGTDQSKKFVYVVNGESKAEYREVTLGQIVDGLQIVKTGLQEGEQIVVGGLQRMRPGAPVKPIPTDMETLKPLEAPAAPDVAATPGELAPETGEVAK